MSRFLLIGLLLFCAAGGIFLFSAAAQDISVAQDYYDRGQKYMAAGDYEKANEFFLRAQQALEADTFVPDAPPEYTLPSSGHPRPALANDTETAILSLKQALEKGRGDKDIYYNLGVLYVKNEDYANAVKCFEEVVAKDKGDADAYYNLGVICESVFNDYGKAAMYYKRYLAYSSDNEEKSLVQSWIDYMQRSNWSRVSLK